MTGTVVALTFAYVAVAALLLNLNLATRWSGAVKVGAIVLVSGLYFVAWQGHRGLLGWATSEPLPEEFRVHWITADEPDKKTGADGVIYFWLRTLDEAGLPTGEPRAYRVPWEEAIAKVAEAALEQLGEGQLLNGSRIEEVSAASLEAPDARTVYEGEESGESHFEFIRVIPPPLPPKSAPRS